jgi:hypothetical protein
LNSPGLYAVVVVVGVVAVAGLIGLPVVGFLVGFGSSASTAWTDGVLGFLIGLALKIYHFVNFLNLKNG